MVKVSQPLWQQLCRLKIIISPEPLRMGVDDGYPAVILQRMRAEHS